MPSSDDVNSGRRVKPAAAAAACPPSSRSTTQYRSSTSAPASRSASSRLDGRAARGDYVLHHGDLARPARTCPSMRLPVPYSLAACAPASTEAQAPETGPLPVPPRPTPAPPAGLYRPPAAKSVADHHGHLLHDAAQHPWIGLEQVLVEVVLAPRPERSTKSPSRYAAFKRSLPNSSFSTGPPAPWLCAFIIGRARAGRCAPDSTSAGCPPG